MGINERVCKWDLFKLVVQKEPFKGSYPGDVPDFKVPEEKVDEIYLAVKKMARCYTDDKTYAVSQYYLPTIDLIEQAYVNSDMKKFQEGLELLVGQIDSE